MKKTVLKAAMALLLALIVSVSAVPAAPAASASAAGTVYVVGCEQWITLRSYPSTKSSALRHVPLYSAMTYLGEAGNGFAMVNYNGVTGYVLNGYIDYMEPQVADRQMQVVNCRQSITLRSEPSTKAAEITQIPLGATVTLLYWKYHPDFYLVNYNGLTGYALKSYLR